MEIGITLNNKKVYEKKITHKEFSKALFLLALTMVYPVNLAPNVPGFRSGSRSIKL